jgi:hypothetical protein
MNHIYSKSLISYTNNKKVCNNYQKGLCGFCKHCNKLVKLHSKEKGSNRFSEIQTKLLDNNWVFI